MLVLLQTAAFYTWFGGNAIGPRYLAPVLPLVGLAAAYGIQRWPEPGLVLTLISIGLMLGVTAIAIDPPGDVLTPLQSFYLVRFHEQSLCRQPGHASRRAAVAQPDRAARPANHRGVAMAEGRSGRCLNRLDSA